MREQRRGLQAGERLQLDAGGLELVDRLVRAPLELALRRLCSRYAGAEDQEDLAASHLGAAGELGDEPRMSRRSRPHRSADVLGYGCSSRAPSR